MESRVKDGTFYIVTAAMVKDLKLKGIERDLFAIIYGFSQDGDSSFSGGLQYLADWTGCTKQYICSALKNMVDKGLLIKSEHYINGIKDCAYRCNLEAIKENETPLRKSEYPVKENETAPLRKSESGIKKSLTNNKEDNKDSYIIEEIITYLNEKTKANYRANNKQTVQVIRARMKEGYTLADFKTVIDNKCAEWLKDSKMRNYLRPQTLFGTKFESYLNGGRIMHDKPNFDMGEYERRAERLPVYIKGAG